MKTLYESLLDDEEDLVKDDSAIYQMILNDKNNEFYRYYKVYATLKSIDSYYNYNSAKSAIQLLSNNSNNYKFMVKINLANENKSLKQLGFPADTKYISTFQLCISGDKQGLDGYFLNKNNFCPEIIAPTFSISNIDKCENITFRISKSPNKNDNRSFVIHSLNNLELNNVNIIFDDAKNSPNIELYSFELPILKNLNTNAESLSINAEFYDISKSTQNALNQLFDCTTQITIKDKKNNYQIVERPLSSFKKMMTTYDSKRYYPIMGRKFNFQDIFPINTNTKFEQFWPGINSIKNITKVYFRTYNFVLTFQRNNIPPNVNKTKDGWCLSSVVKYF